MQNDIVTSSSKTMANMGQPVHELVDFVGLAAQLTNEQKILACLERIEVLLKPVPITGAMNLNPASMLQPKAEAPVGKFTGRRK